jgi:putative phage-type endonuclease
MSPLKKYHPIAQALLLREQWTQRTDAWYERRKTLITASDAGNALNIPLFAGQKNSRAQCIKDKVSGSFKGNIFTRHGQESEPYIAQRLEEIFGEEVLEIGLLVHEKHHWLGASPDGCLSKSGRLVEIKAPYRRQVVPGGHVPPGYWCQMQVQMQVSNAFETIFAQWQPAHLNKSGKEVLDICVVSRDDAWFEAHLKDLYSFWEDLMEARRTFVHPPTTIDSSMYNDLF